MNHTTLPWALDKDGWCGAADIWENQDFIVRAVNNHQKLVDALRWSMSHLEEVGGMDNPKYAFARTLLAELEQK